MERIPTGIKNLDDIIYGGIPAYSLNLISGLPGSGKTILVQNIIFNCARRGLKSIYLTTISESQLKMVRNLGEFRFFDDRFLGEKLIYGDLGTVLRNSGPEHAIGYITDLLKQHRPDIVVIDSIKVIRDLFFDEKGFRTFLFDLAATLSVWEVTAFLVGEYEEREVSLLSEFAIADGIFYLYGQEEKRFQKRFLRVLKLRGSNYQPGEHLFEITENGIVVYPRLRPEEGELDYEVLPRRKGFGIDGLDEMLGGGLMQGTVALLSGPTGSGKTIMALRFLVAGAEQGDRGLFVSFEETPAHLYHAANQLGWDVGRFVDRGLLEIKFISPIELDVDKHAIEILEILSSRQVERFVMDSISSFETGLPSPQKYRDHLWALAHRLRKQRVTALFTYLNEDPFSSLVVSRSQLSLIADHIIFLRYVEDRSGLRKVLGVFKSRGTRHTTDIREYEITPTGVRVMGKVDKADMLR